MESKIGMKDSGKYRTDVSWDSPEKQIPMRRENSGDNIIEELKSKIQTLENENRLLKDRLKEAGVSYADICEEDADEKTAFDPDQGARIRKFEVTDKIASTFL